MRIEVRQRRKESGRVEKRWNKCKGKWVKSARKLHLQFGHASKEKIGSLIKHMDRKRKKMWMDVRRPLRKCMKNVRHVGSCGGTQRSRSWDLPYK